MTEIGAFEAKNSLGGLLDRVVQGEEIVIRRHGKAVARLVPADATTNLAGARIAAASLRALAAELVDGLPVTLDEIAAWRTEGRR